MSHEPDEKVQIMAEISESLSRIASALEKISNATWRNPDGDTVINVELKEWKR